VIVGKDPPLVKLQDQPINTTWLANFMFGADAGLDSPGVLTVDPKLARGEDGIWRPSATSTVIAAAKGDFPFVTEDIEGRPRGDVKDAGCVQHAGKAKRRPMTVRDVGPSWMQQ
jgi:poly(beta-D-mannuronate) lyase